MFGLVVVVIEGMTLSGHLWIINENIRSYRMFCKSFLVVRFNVTDVTLYIRILRMT